MQTQLPLAAVRDLIGIARAMWAAAKRQGDVTRMVELAAIGKKLKAALDLGHTDPRSIGHQAAWTHAEEATRRLMAVITASTPLAPIAEAAVIRIREQRFEKKPSDREQKRAAQRGRS